MKVITPLAAGSASDIALRFLADRLSLRLRVPVIVENQPAAGGVTAARSVINAPHDGYTIAWFGNNTAISVSLFAHRLTPARTPSRSSGSASFLICS
jgi:tripartite-type tricarboxylate transporter receptor subunit TctC